MLDTHAHNPQHIHKDLSQGKDLPLYFLFVFWLIMSNNLQTCYHSVTYVWIVPLYWMWLCWWYRRWSPVWQPSWMCLPSLKSLESRMPTLLSGLYMQVYLQVWLMRSGFFFFSRLQESSECIFAVDIIRLNYWESVFCYLNFKGPLTIRYHHKISHDQKTQRKKDTWL